MAENKGVMIVAEFLNGKLAAISKELLGAGSKLAKDLGEELSVVFIGEGIAGIAPEAIAQGADKVYVVDDVLLKEYLTDAYVAVAEKVIQQVNPRIVLAGQTTLGRDFTPRLAFRLNAAATMDCIDLSIEAGTKKLLMTKPVYGGNARAIFTSEVLPNVATVRVKAMTALAPDASRKGEVVTITAGLDAAAIRTNVLQKVVQEVQGIKLEDATVIVSGGRGMGGPEGFKQLASLAKLLRGAAGASRPPCDSGWVPETMQVGLTGKIVSPDVYIAVAISGSSQHLAGCGGSKNIIAINCDAEANIFKEARFGVVGDWKKVVPALETKLKELLGR
ncbi:MAG: electron transfer flavoprotein subunit alpha/FixB family protein [Dehalococcoidales bacterium]|nr:electron transfer flavoprotein subunit alpha/FixB family protein [Dehalococcoidales bacterium]